MQPTDVLLRGRVVDRRPAILVAVLGGLAAAGALTMQCAWPIRLAAVVLPITIVAAVLIASRATNVVVKHGPLLYVKDTSSNRLVPAPTGARIVCATAHAPNVLLLDAQGRMLAGASVRCPPEQFRRRLAPAGIAVEVW